MKYIKIYNSDDCCGLYTEYEYSKDDILEAVNVLAHYATQHNLNIKDIIKAVVKGVEYEEE